MNSARTIEAGPLEWVDRVRNAPDGATVRLESTVRYPPAHLSGVRHPTSSPVVVDGCKATFTGGITLDEFKPIAADTARLAHRYGRYPGVYPIADQCTLRLSDCHGLTLRNFSFEDSWPTAVYLDNCTDIRFEGFDVTGSSFAFYAVGHGTARLTLQHCRWQQDPEPDTLWRRTYWEEIHDKYEDSDVHRYNGNRAFDGSFFLGRDIAGDVEISGCVVTHAFNGIHLFNLDLNPDLSRNVHVHDCTFSYIRDNVLEPENLAYNWWFYDNTIYNCHKWLSFELASGGWYYVFRNRAWFDDIGGPSDDRHRGGAILKLMDDEGGLLRYPGPIEVFNNSWYVTCPIAKRGAIARLHHHNNAIRFCHGGRAEAQMAPCTSASVFGKAGGAPQDHFTKDWASLDIRFAGDIVHHPHWPRKLVDNGYPLQDGVGEDPGFVDPANGKFTLRADGARARNAGKVKDVLLPDGNVWHAAAPFNAGWHQEDGSVFAGLRYQRLANDIPGTLPIESLARVSARK